MADVTYNHVTKRFPGSTLAVDDLSLEIKDAEFMVLVALLAAASPPLFGCWQGLKT